MVETLPIGDFHFFTDEQVAQFQLHAIAPDSKTGYILECDLEYPPHLHDCHSDYPLAPQHLTVDREMLSVFSSSLAGKQWKPSQKVIANLLDKHTYVCHYRNL